MRYLLILPLLIFCKVCPAQDYIVRTNGDTVKGTITRQKPLSIMFQKTGDDRNVKYGPADLTSYRSGQAVVFVKAVPDMKDGLFLKNEIPGKVSLYSNAHAVSMGEYGAYESFNFYVEKDKESLTFVSGAFYHDSKKYRSEVKALIAPLFSDNKAIADDFAADERKNVREILTDYIEQYNFWCNQRK